MSQPDKLPSLAQTVDTLLRDPDKARIMVTSAVQGKTVTVQDAYKRNIAMVSVDEAIRLFNAGALVTSSPTNNQAQNVSDSSTKPESTAQ